MSKLLFLLGYLMIVLSGLWYVAGDAADLGRKMGVVHCNGVVVEALVRGDESDKELDGICSGLGL
jgi:hypothetical protein